VLWSYSYQRLAVPLVVPSLRGEKSPVASIVRCLPSEIRRRISEPLPYARSATISLYSATARGAYYLYFILVSSVRALD
jgi:hypothetical protein